MRTLSEHWMEAGADFTDGLRLKNQIGSVRIAPSATASALEIEADALDAEAAEHLLSDYASMIEALRSREELP